MFTHSQSLRHATSGLLLRAQSGTTPSCQRIGIRFFRDNNAYRPDVRRLKLPPPVKGWPTPWISKDNVWQYLLPLKIFGWRITRLYIPPSHKDNFPVIPALRNLFCFADSASAWQFHDYVRSLSDEEKVRMDGYLSWRRC